MKGRTLIPNKTDAVEVENNIDADSTGQFSVDENSLAKIMSVLTNLYTDPEGAVVREYLTNALDSQIEAQEADPNYVWRPIEVTTPSRFSKNYVVRDFGIGMSVDDIKDIYSKYGKSTKETSNSVTGMLGLGSKCALTYTGQFTITGYKNGVRCRAIVSKNEENIPIFQIVDTRATDEPNGVEISVPVRDANSFSTKTAEFLRWWKPGQVLVDGASPEPHGYTLVSDDKMEFTINKQTVKSKVEIYSPLEAGAYGYRNRRSYIVMGNVPYYVNPEYISDDLNAAGCSFVAYVPMGSVSFPPNREELLYYPDTKRVITNISTALLGKIVTMKKNAIENAPSKADAYGLYMGLTDLFTKHSNMRGVSYNGLPLSSAVNFAHPCLTVQWNYAGDASVSERSSIGLTNWLSAKPLIVTGCEIDKKPTSTFKKKLNHYITDVLGYDSKSWCILVDNDITNPWVDELPRTDADTIRALKLPASVSKPRREAPYEYVVDDSNYNGYRMESALTIPTPNNETVVYVSPQAYKETYRKRGTDIKTIRKHLGKDYVLVVLGTNRFDKFLRSHPKAISLGQALQERVDNLVKNSSVVDYQVGNLTDTQRYFFTKVPAAQIKDPDLAALANAVQNNKGAGHKQAMQISDWASRVQVKVTVPAPPTTGPAVSNPANLYPLIEEVGARRTDHMVVYINAVYEQRVNSKKP